jgi:hypothetical protein
MGKNDKKDVYNASMDKVKSSENEYNALTDKVGGRSDTTWDRASEDYNPAYQGYLSYSQGGGLTDADKERMQNAVNQIGTAGGGGSGGWGGITNPLANKTSAYQNLNSAYANAYRPDYNEADTGFRKLTGAGGGFDQAQLDKIYGNVDTLSDIGKTGGITDEDKSNILRKSMLEQEETGGYSAQDRALIRAKSAASSPAYFGALKDNLERQRSATGNLANSGAVDFKLARQSAQQQGQDRTNAEIALGDSIRTGRESAGLNLSKAGLDLAGLRTKNQLQGAQSAGDLGLSTQEGITANQATGLRGLADSQTGLGQWGLGQAGGLDQFGLGKAGGLDQFTGNQAQLDMQAQIANAQGAAAGAAGSAANARAAAAANADYQKWVTEYGNQQKQYGIGGLEGLYNTNLGASKDFSGLALDSMNSKYGTQGQLLGLASANRGSTLGEQVGDYAKIAGAAAATYFTGGAAAPMLASSVKGLGQAKGVNPISGATSNPADYRGAYNFSQASAPQGVPPQIIQQPDYTQFGY